MVNQQVPKVNTPVSETELSRSFIEVASALFGVQLTKPQLSILVAQNNLETGGRKAMWNFNIGNITHANDSFDYFMGADKTKDKSGKWVPTTLKFRSYPNLNEGTKDYLNNLHSRGGGSVWNSILKADPVAFSKALKSTKYYEADEKDYTKGILSGVKAYNSNNSYEDALTPVKSPGMLGTIDNLLNHFLQAVAEMQRTNLKK